MIGLAAPARIGLLATVVLAAAYWAIGNDEPADDPDPLVWVNTASGVYHCEDSQHYETTKTGHVALESDARAEGYRPAGDKLCGDGTIQASLDPTLATHTKVRAPENSGPEVWVNTNSGVYHCPGSRYYQATKAGELMSEPAADSAGYRPARGRRCS